MMCDSIDLLPFAARNQSSLLQICPECRRSLSVFRNNKIRGEGSYASSLDLREGTPRAGTRDPNIALSAFILEPV